MLRAKIQQDLIQNMKDRNQERVEVLRYLMSEIKNEEIEKKDELSDEEIVLVLKKLVKKLREAETMFAKGGRDDLAKQNNEQVEIFAEYLPAEMSDDELKAALDELISRNNELYQSKPQAIIGIAMKELSSKADPSRIMAELRSRG